MRARSAKPSRGQHGPRQGLPPGPEARELSPLEQRGQGGHCL